MIVVLIGSPLSGKTSLLKELSIKGVKVFSADTFINQIYKPGKIGYIKIKEELGKDFVNELGVDKRLLAIWATNEDNLKRLNELIHPLIKEYLDGKDGFVAELPIVTNSPIKFKYDKLVLVRASAKTIESRFLESDFSDKSFIKKIISDWNNDIDADLIVDTTNGIEEKDISNIIKLLDEK